MAQAPPAPPAEHSRTPDRRGGTPLRRPRFARPRDECDDTRQSRPSHLGRRNVHRCRIVSAACARGLRHQFAKLPGRGLPLRVYDTASRQVRPWPPGPLARMYVCGITPYDATHSVMRRPMWPSTCCTGSGSTPVTTCFYVQNVTDIDDPLLRAGGLDPARTGPSWRTERRTLFREDMEALRVLPASAYVGAVETIPQIAECVRELRDRGAAYEVDGDIYFSVSSDARFGAVSILTRSTMLALVRERGGDPDRPGKKDPLDPLLWRAERPGEPAWDSARRTRQTRVACRVHHHRARPARHGLRRPGRRYRPDLSASRDERLPRHGAHR